MKSSASGRSGLDRHAGVIGDEFRRFLRDLRNEGLDLLAHRFELGGKAHDVDKRRAQIMADDIGEALDFLIGLRQNRQCRAATACSRLAISPAEFGAGALQLGSALLDAMFQGLVHIFEGGIGPPRLPPVARA